MSQLKLYDQDQFRLFSDVDLWCPDCRVSTAHSHVARTSDEIITNEYQCTVCKKKRQYFDVAR